MLPFFSVPPIKTLLVSLKMIDKTTQVKGNEILLSKPTTAV